MWLSFHIRVVFNMTYKGDPVLDGIIRFFANWLE